jgi:hypothetical protein
MNQGEVLFVGADEILPFWLNLLDEDRILYYLGFQQDPIVNIGRKFGCYSGVQVESIQNTLDCRVKHAGK